MVNIYMLERPKFMGTVVHLNSICLTKHIQGSIQKQYKISKKYHQQK
jgi:hypothetical protein